LVIGEHEECLLKTLILYNSLWTRLLFIGVCWVGVLNRRRCELRFAKDALFEIETNGLIGVDQKRDVQQHRERQRYLDAELPSQRYRSKVEKRSENEDWTPANDDDHESADQRLHQLDITSIAHSISIESHLNLTRRSTNEQQKSTVAHGHDCHR